MMVFRLIILFLGHTCFYFSEEVKKYNPTKNTVINSTFIVAFALA